MAADWLDSRDPWLPARMRHGTEIARWEREIGAAVTSAMAQFLEQARAGVLGESGSTGLTAATTAPPPEEPPNLDGWPADVVWETLLTDIVLPVVGAVFDAAFEAAYRAVITASEIAAYRVIYLGTVWDRLRDWPRGAFEDIRDELAEGIAAGETIDRLRNRVGRALNIDARSRAIEDRIRSLETTIDDPTTPENQRRAARAERRQLYRDLDVENSRWQWKARRIARTETIGSYSAGAYYSAEAWQQTSGKEMWVSWLATSDTRTRGAHIVADGQVRRLGEPFSVGGVAMRFPGDPLAPADLVVNCRCALLALDTGEAAEQQALYDRTRPDRTDINGNPLDDTGRPIVAAAQPPETPMPMPTAETDDLPDAWRGVAYTAETVDRLNATTLPIPLRDDATGITIGQVTRAWADQNGMWIDGDLDPTADGAADVIRTIVTGQVTALNVDDVYTDTVTLTADQDDADGQIIGLAIVVMLPGSPPETSGDTAPEPAPGALATATTRDADLPPADRDDAADTDEADADVDAAALPTRWRGILAPLDTPSGDGRIIATPETLRTRPLPVPLLYQDALSAGHDGAIVVGTIDRAWIEDGMLMGEGRFDLDDPRSAEVVRRVADNFLGGISVDLDDTTSETRCMRAGQLVDCDDLIEVDDDGIPVGVVDGVLAVDVATSWRLMAATLVSQPAFPEARIYALTDLEASAWTAMQNLPPLPAAWFAEPTAEELLPGSGGVHYDNGRIYGWVAQAGVPHAVHGYTIEQLGDIDFTEFLRSRRTLDDGTSVRVGAFTMNVGHHRDGAECETAACQWDNTRTVAGIVTVGINSGGMWFSGAGAPWISEWDRQVFAACQPSYHMKPGKDGRYELRAVLTVPVPAHSSPLAASIIQRSNLALAASAATASEPVPPATPQDAEAAASVTIPSAREIAAALYVEIQAAAARQQQATALQRRMTGPRVAALAARMGRN